MVARVNELTLLNLKTMESLYEMGGGRMKVGGYVYEVEMEKEEVKVKYVNERGEKESAVANWVDKRVEGM